MAKRLQDPIRLFVGNVGGLIKILLISFICYVPAYGLVFFCFKSFENFAPAEQSLSTSESEILRLEGRIQTLQDQVNNVKENLRAGKPVETKASTGTKLEEEQQIINLQKDLLRVEKEAKSQAEKAAQDELKNVKGDLLGQISFPLLSIIASIFAAFIVKDMIMQILNKDQVTDLKTEIYNDVMNDLGSEIYPLIQKKVDSDLASLGIESARINILHLIDQIQKFDQSQQSNTSEMSDEQKKLDLQLFYEVNKLRRCSSRIEGLSKELKSQLKDPIISTTNGDELIKEANRAMSNIPDIRIHQLHEMLTNILDLSNQLSDTERKVIKDIIEEIRSPEGPLKKLTNFVKSSSLDEKNKSSREDRHRKA